jgi:Rap1a immunity proteins
MSVRKRRWTILGGAVALALTATAAGAVEKDTSSANYMMPGCKYGLDPDKGPSILMFDAGVCVGIVGGIAHMLDPRNRGDWCADIPASATRQQMVRVVVRFIEARPNLMHQDFMLLALMALADAWPCKK